MFKLTKSADPYFKKISKAVKFMEWDELGSGKAVHENPSVGYSLIMSPFNHFFTWQTTKVTEIISDTDILIHFKTKNSEYILYKNVSDEEE